MDFKDKFATSWKNRKFSHSLRHACDGLITLFKEERNFRFELICLSLVVIAGLIFHLPISEWLWLIAASAIVLIAEAANTAIENLTDLASHLHSNDFAKKGKGYCCRDGFTRSGLCSDRCGIDFYSPHYCFILIKDEG